jgi:glycolate oxidase FAD binding subunit
MDVQIVLNELRERVVAAHQQRQPLRLRGAGTKYFYAEDAGPGDDAAIGPSVLDLRPYRGIVEYEPSELVVTARCGTPLSEIETALAEQGQFLAFEPPAFGGDPTIGGVIAAGLSGPRRMYAGAARDFVLGATLLNARGDILRFGGKVMKNVAGFDVSRLLCGSLGILGVITEVSLKVLPRPRAEETLRFEMPARQAIEAFNRWSGQPLPLSGAAWWDGLAWLRLSGASSAVRAAHERLGGERMDPTAAMQWWNDLRHCQHPIFRNGTSPANNIGTSRSAASPTRHHTLWRLSVPDTTPPLPLPGDPLIDWGGALRWYAYEPQSDDAPRNVASAAAGTAMCWRGPAPASGRFHPLQPTAATLTRRLKDRFDPNGIFNPGRMIAGL